MNCGEAGGSASDRSGVLRGSFKIDFDAGNDYRFKGGSAAAFVGLNRFKCKRASQPRCSCVCAGKETLDKGSST